MKQTKIVATISDIRCEVDFIQSLYDAGINVIRLNTAHMDMKLAETVVANARTVSDKIGILVDTKGPEIRTCDMKDVLEVSKGDEIRIGANLSTPGFNVSYDNYHNEVPVGSSVLIDDGEMCLTVTGKEDGCLVCVVENTGKIKNKKSVNTPDVNISLPSVSERDYKYIQFAIDQGLDFIAHSFVRHVEDVRAIQSELDKVGSKIKIIAKIENREGVDNIDSITDEVYGVMVARGDLGIEIPQEEVPIVQKKIIEVCRLKGVPVITATQMLHTMIDNPRPTRAEVSDIANAVYDGTDAIMLSGETAYGDHPVAAVETMTAICQATEPQRPDIDGTQNLLYGNKVLEHICSSAVRASVEMPIKAIMANTATGRGPRFLSSYRGKTPIYAVCHTERVMRELALTRGVYAVHGNPSESTDQLIAQGFDIFTKSKDLEGDDMVVVVAGTPGHSEFANFMEICTPDTWSSAQK